MPLGQSLAEITGNKTFMDESDRYKKIEIEDIPIMISDDGAIVCIPKTEEVKSMAFVGNSGMGKSLLMNRVHSFIYHHWNCNLALMNDVSEESLVWDEPMKNWSFNQKNKIWLNQDPIGTPLCYVFPHTKTLEIDYKKMVKKNFLVSVLPFKEVMEDVGFYLAGVNENFELGKSGMYLNKLKEDLIKCDTPAQIRETLDEFLPGKDGKSYGAMRQKILTAFDSLLEEEILDVTNPEHHSYLMKPSEGILENPLIALMKEGFVPSLITSDLVNKKYKSQVFAYHIKSIFENNTENFPEKQTYMFFDELRDVCESDNEPAAVQLGRVAARGRIKNVGVGYATQFYDKIPKKVKGAKLNYLFAFKHGDESIVNLIRKDFSLNSKWKEKILNLKPHECIAMTQENFVLYRDNEKWISQGPIKGSIFYPLANHQKGGVKK